MARPLRGGGGLKAGPLLKKKTFLELEKNKFPVDYTKQTYLSITTLFCQFKSIQLNVKIRNIFLPNNLL